eukprot:CAMPEP_0204909344 /NCGR_PEP_ID=MMETSP1397-20131031/8087_1 /ASSEMBLY_ACC=CAM_ASM_000891 /TAXON_ID=49980 /ORGANISM="Climacostomum Climacostomum virens, Strain Stock W-24" /LENGTH=681 /DNA_ID=CAMNT_0052079153 /DNA_START=16 /DNA_END=2058 /DNA_ORIENTATION=+
MVSSTLVYPFFTRLVQESRYYSVHNSLFCKYFKWRKSCTFFSFIYGTDAIGDIYRDIEDGNIDIINPMEKAVVGNPAGMTYEEAAQIVRDSEIRPVGLFTTPADGYQLIKALYKAGLRAKDILISTISLSYRQLSLIAAKEDQEIIDEFRQSLVSSDFSTFVGSSGEALSQRMKEQFSILSIQDCYIYDAVTQATIASDYSIKRGLNFFEWNDFTTAVRSIRFNGCSGLVMQSQENNNIKESMITFGQSRLNSAGAYEEVRILQISNTGSQTYFVLDKFIFADGTSNFPKEARYTYEDCPFPEEFKVDSSPGMERALMLNFMLTAISVVVAVGTYFLHYRHSRFVLSKEPFLPGTQDKLMVWLMLVDPLCAYFINPSRYNLTDEISIIKNIRGTDVSDGAYYNILAMVYCLISLWAFLTLIVVFCKFRPMIVDIQLFSAVIIRGLSFILMYILVTTFDCSEANSPSSDPSLTDSFMDVDCSEYCWKGMHLLFAILSFAFLATFLILAIVFSSPIMNLLEGLQFETNPIYSIVRLPLIMTLLSIRKSDLSIELSSSLYFAILGSYIGLCAKIKVFDVPSISMTHNFAYILVMMVSLVHLISTVTIESTWLWWFLIAFVAFITRALYFLFSRRLPRLLLKEDKMNTNALFAFAFRTSTTQTAIHRSTFLERNNTYIVNSPMHH